jgi:SAM-dependent methyltransferase
MSADSRGGDRFFATSPLFMSTRLEFTGERFVPGTEGEIAHEHWHRYAFAQRFLVGKRVVDVACGEGYGSALVAGIAANVVGVDIDPQAVTHARASYAGVAQLRFVEGSATALPLPDASADAVVSFETIEHLDAADQPRMMAEFARVLVQGGLLVLSSPNRIEYSEARHYVNPYHRCELDREELARLLDPAFPACRWYRQRRYLGSALWAEEGNGAFELWSGDAQKTGPAVPPEAMYFFVVAARDRAFLPPTGPALSLYADRDDREWRRIEAAARDVLRLDDLLKERDAALDRQTAHIHHLEELVAHRERIVTERDAQLIDTIAKVREVDAARAAAVRAVEEAHDKVAASEAEHERLERAITAQERIIAYRQSARWWIKLPWLRVRLLWNRIMRA